ncbi:MAG: DUF2851 family protein [Thermoflexibacteraceae bacterium]
MNEAFLHYIWQFQYFNSQNLQTTQKEPLQILKAGYWNTDSGADFQQAEVLIDGIRWVGSVEIHLNSTDWQTHQHSQNNRYNNVILHVVWRDNSQQTAKRPDGSMIPTLVLEGRVKLEVLEKYHEYINSQHDIPCEKQWETVSNLQKMSMLDYVLAQRLQKKAEKLTALLEAQTGDWEETTYQWLAQSFGFKVNNEAFLALAQATPYRIFQKNKDDLTTIEALLFGQASLLPQNPTDDYSKNLVEKYNYLRHKYSLTPIAAAHWKFMRLRPANFPTVRIAQLAALLYQQSHWFSALLAIEDIKQMQQFFKLQQSAYWQAHYDFGKTASQISHELGKESINNLIINTVAPLLAAYSQQQDNELFMERALTLLEGLPAEHNKITQRWEDVGLTIGTAFDSQATIELYNEFCTKKRCLQCRIGKELIR